MLVSRGVWLRLFSPHPVLLGSKCTTSGNFQLTPIKTFSHRTIKSHVKSSHPQGRHKHPLFKAFSKLIFQTHSKPSKQSKWVSRTSGR